MATAIGAKRRKKKTTTARKTTSRKKRSTSRVRGSASSDTPKIARIGGESFTHTMCSTSKSQAKAKANTVRDGGRKARVIKKGNRYCVFAGGARKKK